MELTSIQSSNLFGFTFVEDADVLVVKFKDGAVYAYPCDPAEYAAFEIAPSKGRFLHDRMAKRGVQVRGKEAAPPPDKPADFAGELQRAKNQAGPAANPGDCGFAVVAR